MAANEEEVLGALTEALGGRPSSREGLQYAKRILDTHMMGMPGPEVEPLEQMRNRSEEVRGALIAARERLLAQRGPSRGEALLALSAGLGAPTRTGAIGETAANVSRQLLPHAQAQREFETGRDAQLTELDIALAGVGSDVTQAEFDLAKIAREQEGRLATEALKTIARGTSGRGGSGTREAKIADLMELHNLPRGAASALVDGFVDIEVVEQLGTVRLIDEINKKAYEVPLEALEDLEEFLPNDDRHRPTPPTPDSRDSHGSDYRTAEERAADDLVVKRMEAGDSLWDMAGTATGPWAAARVGGSYLSSLFGVPQWVATKTIEGRQGLKIRSRDLARALIDNPRMPVRLVEMALEDAAMSPSALDTPELMQTRMVALDRELWDRYLDAIQDAGDTSLPLDVREAQKANARALQIFLRDLRVPTDRQKRRDRATTLGYLGGEDPDTERFRKPPPGFGGSELEWRLMPLEDRELWAEFYEE